VELDAFDRKILRHCCSANNRLPQRDIGEAVNLSAVGREPAHRGDGGRRRDPVANIAVVDPAKVGRPITIIVEVTVESERLDLLDAVKKRRIVACPQVQQVYYVTGEVDFVVILAVAGHGRICRRFRASLFFAEGNVKTLPHAGGDGAQSKVGLAVTV
jgi:Lrp/AsnC family leucine-responsive transcriptional regulator